MVKVCIFDFDGTIANTIPAGISILKHLSRSYFDKSLGDKDIRDLRDKTIPEAFKELNVPLIKLPLIARRTRKELNKRIATLKPIDGIKSLMQKLRESGLVLGIVSSNSKESIQKFLEANGMEFDFIYTSSRVFGKGNSLKKVLKDHTWEKKEVVYIGDEIRDIEAARKVGIRVVSVTWGVNSREKLVSYGPDFLVDSPREISDILQSAN